MRAQREAERAALEAKQRADEERRAKTAELERDLAKLEAAGAEAEAKRKEQWQKLDPRLRNMIDPEATAEQYALVEAYLRAHPDELFELVEKTLQDNVVRLLELSPIESHWELIAKPKARARTKTLLQNLQHFPVGVVLGVADSKLNTATAEPELGLQCAIAADKRSDKACLLDGLRTELIVAAIRDVKLTADERAKLAKLFGVDSAGFTALETELGKEASAAQHEAIERFLRLHPAELLRHVEWVYRDDKVTNLEYEVVKAVKEQTQIAATKARINAKLKELRSGPR